MVLARVIIHVHDYYSKTCVPGLGKIQTFSRFLLLQTSLSFYDYKILGEVVGTSQDDSDGAGKAAQAKAQVGSTLGHFNHGEIFSCLRKKNLKFHL